MNSFGRLFRLSILGESHGPCVAVLLDGVPAGLPLCEEDFVEDLARRRPGAPGTTARREEDRPRLLSGVHQGRCTGAPLLIAFDNTDADSSAYADLPRLPRPGHADWVAWRKFGGHADPRGGGAFSGRLTLGLVAAGVVAKRMMPELRFESGLLMAGGDPEVQAAAQAAAAQGDSVGGLLEGRVLGLPPGLGEPFFDALESVLAHLLFAIPGIKGVEFGEGFACAAMRGSAFNDPIAGADGRTLSNHAGGVNGGISNGNPLLFRAAMRPAASIALPQRTVDLATGETADLEIRGRHDACIALRAPVLLEAAAAVVLADFMLLEQRIGRVVEAGRG